MDKTSIRYSEKQIKKVLSSVGAKVVKAVENSYAATKLLQDAQSEIADLYESLGDILGVAEEEKLEPFAPTE